MQTRGGAITEDDFGNYSTVLQQPAEITYQGKYFYYLHESFWFDLNHRCLDRNDVKYKVQNVQLSEDIIWLTSSVCIFHNIQCFPGIIPSIQMKGWNVLVLECVASHAEWGWAFKLLQ